MTKVMMTFTKFKVDILHTSQTFYSGTKVQPMRYDLCQIEPGDMGGGNVTETRNPVGFLGSLIMNWIRVE